MKRFVILIGILLVASCAYAGPVPGPDFTNPVIVNLISFSGGAWQNGYPYTISITGGMNPIPAMCDDYLHGGSIGESWQANITNLGTQGIALARFNIGPNCLGLLTNYREAGWILLQTQVTPPNEYLDMNYAVWHIFDPALQIGPGAQTWLNAAEAEAAMGFPGVTFDQVYHHDSDPPARPESQRPPGVFDHRSASSGTALLPPSPARCCCWAQD